VQEYREDEAGYSTWLDHHPDGFVINVHTSGKKQPMLHRARCLHLDESKTKHNQTKSGKACTDTSSELVKWADANGHRLTYCRTCKPV